MGGLATFPAVIPELQDSWGLSNTAAGWITGSYHAGYMLGVPFLAALSDRIDAKRILIASTGAAALTSAAVVWVADGLWAAVICQIAAGAALAGIYMPGLKGLADRVAGPAQGRYISFYTASFTVGASLSFVVAGVATRLWGWRSAFAAAALAQAGALVLVSSRLPPAALSHADAPLPASRISPLTRISRRFGPVFRSRQTMDFIVGYGAHMWELFALRSWIVPFLAFTLSRQGATAWSAPAIAAFVTILGVPASIAGQEAASRVGPRRLIVAVMIASAVLAFITGWTAELPTWVAVVAVSVYSMAVSADSAPLTAAAVAAAPEGYRGSAMAVHSTLGFTAAMLGTLAVGAALDLSGGESTTSWGIAFAVMGCTGIAGAWRLARAPA